MPKFTKIIIGISFTLVLLSAGMYFSLRYLITKSFPVTEGTVELKNLHAPVEVYRDEYGVPHIKAHDEHDLIFAAGYIHAQDRLWQMDLMRRAGQGRLSEIFDTNTVQYDKLFRTLGLSYLAESLFQHMHPTSRRILNDYTDGINEFISTHLDKLPVEFDILNYKAEYWKPQHSVMIMRLLAWELSFAWWVKLSYAEISALVPPAKFREILISSGEYSSDFFSGPESKLLSNEIGTYLRTVRDYRAFFNLGSFSAGSNAWVVDSSKSFSGKPILANDPHLLISLPSKWFEIHLSAPGWNVAGVSLPGVPLVLIGHNDSVAWGCTNAMLDDADFYIEQADSFNLDNYYFKNALFTFQKREEKIFIGSNDSIVVNVRSTNHGPVINDVHYSLNRERSELLHPKNPVSLQWTGYSFSDEILCFYRLDRATNWYEFEEGIKQLTVPGQCFVYADIRGNIGSWVSGRVPIRNKKFGALPLKGWTGEAEWQGYLSFDQMPKLRNPASGYIISANQNYIDKSYPFYFSDLFEPPSRYERIKELLSVGKFTVQDFQQFQQDVVSNYEKELVKYILSAFSKDTIIQPDVNAALIYLRNWNFKCTQYDIAATIVNSFFMRLLHNIYEDELGNEVFKDFIYFPAIPYGITSSLLQKENSAWFDNIRTENTESKNDIIKKSFLEALHDLQNTLGDEMKNWQWGKLHQVFFLHPLGKVKPFDKVLNIGPFPLGGSGETINKAAFALSDPFHSIAGPSMRQIIDFADQGEAYMVSTLGQSGQPLSKHYDDQISLWLIGGYRKVTINWEKIKNENWEHLIFKPK